MAIDTTKEEICSLAQAGRHARPPDAAPFSPSTIFRWYTKGFLGITLETICIGGIRYTSVEALQRFFVAVTLARSTHDVAAEPNAEAGTRSAATKKRLQEAGLS